MSGYQPVIVIGAARSGTKLLRDLTAAHPALGKVPYDVNYIWRMGNQRLTHDELRPEMLTPKKRARIRAQLVKCAGNRARFVEKTVSNCLRVPYVWAVLPEARFLHLVRDGRDVIESVYREWTAPPDWRYIWRKARRFPLRHAFGYAIAYGLTTLHRTIQHNEGPVGIWGARYQGIEADLARYDLLTVCALQWAHCVESAARGLAQIPPERQLTLRYEEFVEDPAVHLMQIATLLAVDATAYETISRQHHVSQKNVGKGRRGQAAEKVAGVMPHLENGLRLLRYL